MAPIAIAIAVSTAFGVWAERRWGARASRATRTSLLVVLYAALPPIIFFNLARASFEGGAGLGLVCAYAALGLATVAAWLICRRLGLSRPVTGSVLCCVVIANTGYLGYPVTAALLGFDSLTEAVVYDIVVAAPMFLVVAFSIGAAFGTTAGEGAAERIRAFFTRNPPLAAAALALIAPDALAPDYLVDASRILVIAILPVGFVAIGVALAEEAERRASPFPPPIDAAIATAVGARLLLAPAALLLIATPVVELPDAYLLLAAMPCGINALIVTHAYGLDMRTTAAAIAWSTALAVALCAGYALI